MSDEAPAYVPSKEEIKANLPISYVCDKLGIRLNHDGRCLCPFHDERDPSFYLWVGDDGQTRWWCQPCGIGGDVYDLLARYYNCGFGEALGYAQQLYADMEPGTQARTFEYEQLRPAAEMWGEEVGEAQARAVQQAGRLALLSGMVTEDEDPRVAQAWDSYLRTAWGWGISEQGQIYMPHYDPDGVFTGAKVRNQNGRKESLPGSKYENLYGCWNGLLHRDVLLTEGETDCVWASRTAYVEGIPLTVLALPRGGASGIEGRWLEWLRSNGARKIYLALDPDKVGVEATRKWIDALTLREFRHIRICTLPLERDLRAARPTIRHLLEHAKNPLFEGTEISATAHGYYKMTQAGDPVQITTWTVDPIAQLAGGTDPGYDVELVHAGVTTREVILLADLATVQSLNKWCNRRSILFNGNDRDRAKIAEKLQARGHVTPEIFQTDRVGLHSPPPQYEFAGPTIVYPSDYTGDLPFRYAPSPKIANVQGRVPLPYAGDAKIQWDWLDAFLALSSTDVTHPLAAWVFATGRRPECDEFPLLFLSGSSGVGKSTLARLAMRLAGSEVEIDLGSTTAFVLVRTLAASASLPVFIDEWTRLSRRDSREAFQGAVPTLYAGGVSERGQADLGAQTYQLTSPVIVAGEDTFTLDRERDRVITLKPTRANQNLEALQLIQGRPLELYAAAYHRFLVTEYAKLPSINTRAANRPEHNRDVLLAGWETLHAFLAHAQRNGVDVPELPVEPDLSCFEIDPKEVEANAYEEALREGEALHDNNHLPVVWADPDGQGTWVRARTLLGLIETRHIDIQLPGRSRAMLAYFRERYEVDADRKVAAPLTNQEVRAALIRGLHLNAREETA